MKNAIKFLGIIVMVAVIGFSMAACDFGSGDDDKNGDGNGNGDGGGGGTNPTIHIKNATGYSFWSLTGGLYIKPDTEAQSWGSNWVSIADFYDGDTRDITLSKPLSSHNVYDFRINAGGYNFIKYGVTVLRGMTITISQSDLDNLSSQPKIVLQNRSGKDFNSIFIKPSVSDEWGNSFGSVGNNGNKDITILIPPSSYTVFDIQMKSTNPTNSYTKNNVSISDGMTLLFSSADAETSFISEPPVIVIENKTGYSFWSLTGQLNIRSTGSDSWGSNWVSIADFYDQTTRAVTLTNFSVGQSIDIRIYANSQNFIKSAVQIQEGMIVTISQSDFQP
jgi:hypothetical protein